MDKLHDIDSNRFQALSGDFNTKRANIMQHQNIVFHGLLKHIPWGIFNSLVDKHKTDVRVRKLSTKTQFIALLYGQFSGVKSLRDIETNLKSHSNKLYHLGAKPICRATLAEANSGRSHEVFSSLLKSMMGMLNRKFRRDSKELIRLIDSTSVSLSGIASEWAKFSDNTCAAKAHIIYDPDSQTPVYVSVTPAKTNDITAAQLMPIEDNATYVFDKAYCSYAWWAKLEARGARFVTRIKSHVKPEFSEERDVSKDSKFVSDRIGMLPKRQTKNRQNPFKTPIRVIEMTRDCGENIRFITNDLIGSAQDITDLYKRRWAIELFFKWIKQVLKIKHFLGRSENAVRIQIAVALIAYILLRLARDSADTAQSILNYTRLVRANLMHPKTLDKLLKPPTIISRNKNQLQLDIGEV